MRQWPDRLPSQQGAALLWTVTSDPNRVTLSGTAAALCGTPRRRWAGRPLRPVGHRFPLRASRKAQESRERSLRVLWPLAMLGTRPEPQAKAPRGEVWPDRDHSTRLFGRQIPISGRRHRSSRYARTEQALGILDSRLRWKTWRSDLSLSCKSVALRITPATTRIAGQLHRQEMQQMPAQSDCLERSP